MCHTLSSNAVRKWPCSHQIWAQSLCLSLPMITYLHNISMSVFTYTSQPSAGNARRGDITLPWLQTWLCQTSKSRLPITCSSTKHTAMGHKLLSIQRNVSVGHCPASARIWTDRRKVPLSQPAVVCSKWSIYSHQSLRVKLTQEILNFRWEQVERLLQNVSGKIALEV